MQMMESPPHIHVGIIGTVKVSFRLFGKFEVMDTSKQCDNYGEPASHPYLQSIVDQPDYARGENLNLANEKRAIAFIRGNPDSFCNTSDEKILSQVLNNYDLVTKDFFRWQIEYSQKALSGLIANKSGIDFGKIKSLNPVSRGASGRLLKLQIIGTKKSLTIGKELMIRRWLSKTHLFSSAIVIESENPDSDGIPETFIFYGAGWGHGVGLCQIGAAVMGARGYTHDEILKHYYRGAEIEKSYS